MDQRSDKGQREFHKIAATYNTPDYVKQASHEELCGNSTLPTEAYGDPKHRLFPCDTAAATWTSAAFFLEKKALFKPTDAEFIEKRITRCAHIHGIGNAVDELKKKVESIKLAKTVIPDDSTLSDDDFALVWEENGSKRRHYRMVNVNEVKAAADYLVKHRVELPFEIRQQIADKILQKQAEYGVTLGALNEYITKQAGHGASPCSEVVTAIKNRVKATRQGNQLSELQSEMLKFATMLESNRAKLREPGMRVKVAGVIDQFDRTMKIKQYDSAIRPVEDVVFGLTGEKMAEVAKEHCGLLTGSIYKLADLERVKLAEIRDYFGDGFADRVTSDGLHVDSEKAAALLPTLPVPDAIQLDRLLSSLGVQPIAKEASQEQTRLSEQYLGELAGEYRQQLAHRRR
jgi:hypothetical protein